jgi:hypothetical protein
MTKIINEKRIATIGTDCYLLGFPSMYMREIMCRVLHGTNIGPA